MSAWNQIKTTENSEYSALVECFAECTNAVSALCKTRKYALYSEFMVVEIWFQAWITCVIASVSPFDGVQMCFQ
mgnify:CR=1 FL=1